jgi:hypothetical protein
VPHALAGLNFPHGGNYFWAVPQLVLLDEVNAKYKGFIQVRNYVKFRLKVIGAKAEFEIVSALNW